MEKRNRFEQIAEIAALLLLVAGCYWIIHPFLVAVAWAAIICFATWPVYHKLKKWFRNPQSSALIMTLLVTVVIVAPMTLIGFSLADDVGEMIRKIRHLLREGLPDPPAWLSAVPLVGPTLDANWKTFSHNGENLLEASKLWLSQSRGWFVQRGLSLGHGIIQLCLSVFITFFFYRDGLLFLERAQQAIKRIVGDRTQHLLAVVGSTTKGVVYGIIGTALAQALLAGLGFWVAGVPLPLVLGLATFIFALIPFGPPLIWVPACAWLFFSQEEYMRGLLLAAWGTFVVSGIDNVLRPYLISRESKLPFILVFLGVLGGVIAFGFIGIFIGPVLLSVGFTLLKEWAVARKSSDAHA